MDDGSFFSIVLLVIAGILVNSEEDNMGATVALMACLIWTAA